MPGASSEAPAIQSGECSLLGGGIGFGTCYPSCNCKIWKLYNTVAYAHDCFRPQEPRVLGELLIENYASGKSSANNVPSHAWLVHFFGIVRIIGGIQRVGSTIL